MAGPCSDGAASPAAASDQPWLAVAEDAAIAEDVCLDCRVCQEGRALSGDAAVASGRPLVEGQEWKEMLEGHVKGFSASFTSRLSDWNAKQDALQNAPHDTLVLTHHASYTRQPPPVVESAAVRWEWHLAGMSCRS